MLFTFVALAVVYTLLLDAIALVGYRISAQRDFDHAVDAVARQAAEYTDFQLKSVQELGMLLRSSDYMSKYLLENPKVPDRYSRLKLQQFINGIYGVASTQRRDFAVTKLVDDYVMLRDSTGNIAFMLERFAISREQLDAVVQSFTGQVGQPMRLMQSEDEQGRRVFTIVTRQWVGRPYPFYMLVSFEEGQLFASDATKGGTLILRYGGKEWARHGGMGDEAVDAALAGDGRGTVLREMPSAIAGVTYLYVTRESSALRTTSLLIALAGAAALIASALFMLWVTKRMYSPIAQVLSSTGSGAVQGDEFAGIQQTFDSLNTSVANMTTSMSQYYDTLENKFFYDLLTGLVTQEKVPERLRQFKLSAVGGPFVAVLVRYAETVPPGTDTDHGIVYEVRNALTKALKDTRSLYRVVDVSLLEQAFIFRQTDPAALREQLRGLLLTVEPEYGMETTAFVGTACDDLQHLRDSYWTAQRLAEQSEYAMVKSTVLGAEEAMEADTNAQHNVYYPLRMEQALIAAVIHAKTSTLQTMIHDLVSANEREHGGNLSLLSLMLTATVNRILDGIHGKVEEIFADDTIIYLEFRACKDYREIEAQAFAIFSALSARQAQAARQSSQSIEKKMTDYIDKNYDKDISMFDLADYVNLSKNYVSTLFKSSTGRTFKDYLSELRYEKAREIIDREANVLIRDVAARVGCSPDTLLRLFMRYSGISPSEYQQKKGRGEDA